MLSLMTYFEFIDPPLDFVLNHILFSLCMVGSFATIAAALNPHFLLVNYTGAAGDPPGENPRKIGPGVREIRQFIEMRGNSAIANYPPQSQISRVGIRAPTS